MMLHLAQNADEPTGGLAGWAVDLIDALGGLGLALLSFLDNMLLGVLPVDVMLPLVGYSATQGGIHVGTAIACATAGSVIGSLVPYSVGARLGRDRTRALLVKLPGIKGETVDRAEAWFARHGAKAVLFGRMLPGIRPLISVPAGVERMPVPKFMMLTSIGSSIWTSVLVLAGYLLGENWHRVTDVAGVFSSAVLGAFAVIGVTIAVKRRNRRRQKEKAAIDEKERTGVA